MPNATFVLKVPNCNEETLDRIVDRAGRILLIFGICSVAVSCSSKPDCSRFKIGDFEYRKLNGEKVVLVRNDSFQIERSAMEHRVMRSKIKWISDCEYTLSDMQALSETDSVLGQMYHGLEFHTKIFETHEDYCIMTSQLDKSSFKVIDTFWIAKAIK